MKLLTFLGTGEYQKTTYVLDDYRCETEFVAEALATWLSADKVVVFLTKEAAQHENWKQLSHRLQRIEVQTVSIPDGRTEQEIWEIFDCVVTSVEHGDEIAIDVTHAFRSLPMVLVAVAAFLRTVKEVRVRHIFYGCYMKGEPAAPVIDLNLLLELLDWMEATRRFKEIGDARWIGEKLRSTQDRLRREQKGEPTSLKSAGDRLITLSQALQLARPIDAAKAAKQLQGLLPKASGEIQTWAKPFTLLIDDVQAQVEQLAYENTDVLDSSHLEKQLQFIEQLHQYGLVMQAAQMAREWVVNWAMWYSHGEGSLSQGEWLDPCRRGYIESVLSSAFRAGGEAHPPDWLKDPDLIAILRDLWPSLADLRNDFAHCGMRKQPLSSEDLYNQSKNLLPQLRDLWQKSEP
ncbi:MAG: TIGR02221 family CRISPR-associated protein [Firmicutes bacterium]|nr:TIGR02221 family CRISPR-associated protein [Bacillota bacterium]